MRIHLKPFYQVIWILSHKAAFFWLFISTALIFSASPTYAATHLKAFSAQYELVVQSGITSRVKGTRTLKKLDNNQWQLSVNASTFLAKFSESSRFLVQDDYIRPFEYQYHTKVVGKRRDATLLFDWDTLKVTNNVQDKPWRLSITPHTLDKLSYQLQLQADLANNRSPLQYKVADGGYLKDYIFEKNGEENVETAAGEFKCIRVERIYRDTNGQKTPQRTTLWFAPELDYQLVKLEQQKDKKRKSILTLLKIK